MLNVAVRVERAAYRLEFIHAERRIVPGGPVQDWHNHAVYHVVYVDRGTGVFRLGKARIPATAGRLFLISPGEWHQFIADPSDPFTYYEVTFALLDAALRPCTLNAFDLFGRAEETGFRPELRVNPIQVPADWGDELIEAFLAVIRECDGSGGTPLASDPFRLSEIEVRVLAILVKVGSICTRLALEETPARVRPTHQQIVNKAKAYLRAERYRSPAMADIARRLHLDPAYFSALFKQTTGITPREYLNNVRLEEARKLLSYTATPVANIARHCGFRDPAYFCRVFKKLHRTTPTAYRQQNRHQGMR